MKHVYSIVMTVVMSTHLCAMETKKDSVQRTSLLAHADNIEQLLPQNKKKILSQFAEQKCDALHNIKPDFNKSAYFKLSKAKEHIPYKIMDIYKTTKDKNIVSYFDADAKGFAVFAPAMHNYEKKQNTVLFDTNWRLADDTIFIFAGNYATKNGAVDRTLLDFLMHASNNNPDFVVMLRADADTCKNIHADKNLNTKYCNMFRLLPCYLELLDKPNAFKEYPTCAHKSHVIFHK